MRGAEFRELRLRAGLSIRLAATRCGISPSTVVEWETRDMEVRASAADAIKEAAGETPDIKTVCYALGRITRCCADVWEGARSELPLDLYNGMANHPATYLGTMISRTRLRSPQRFAAVEDEIQDHMQRIPPDGLPQQLADDSEGAGSFWLGYYHRGAERRLVKDLDREDRDN